MRRAPQRTAGLMVAALLHLGLLWIAMRPAPRPAEQDNRIWLQFVPPPRIQTPEPPPPALPKPAAPVARRAQPEAPPTVAAPPSEPAPAAPADSPEEQALLADPAKPARAKLSPDLAQLALQSVGAIDRQLRSEHPQTFAAPLALPNARLAQGIAAAHAAVKPKWFEQARSELISAPNDPNRIYKITTALGEYCLYYPDKSSIARNNHAKSGWAGFGQPTMAGCPIPF